MLLDISDDSADLAEFHLFTVSYFVKLLIKYEHFFFGKKRLCGITLLMLTLHILENCSSNFTGLGTTYNITSVDD